MNQTPPLLLDTAELVWDERGQPFSPHFQDRYYCKENGLAETEHVFLRYNHLKERFSSLTSTGAHFCIAELGFGTGLNFLAAWRCWLDSTREPGQVLHFVSFERHPLKHDDVAQALSSWPELADLSTELLKNYPQPLSGPHRRVLANGSVRLTLYFGDVRDGLNDLFFLADAWFLDGFSPARNPDMWLDTVIQGIRAHSRAQATFSTFTSAGHVRQALSEQDFEVRKVTGFGNKRDMLCGQLSPQAASGRGCTAGTLNWLRPPSIPSAPKTALVIGAGMAGCLVAQNLASRGLQVCIVDMHPAPGMAASGNPQGALYFKPGVDWAYQDRLALAGYLFSLQHFNALSRNHANKHPEQLPWWHPVGLIQAAHNKKEADHQHQLLHKTPPLKTLLPPLSADAISDLANQTIDWDGLHFEHSGWIAPPLLCQAALEDERITFQGNTEISQIEPLAQGGWQAQLSNGDSKQADLVIICNADACTKLLPPDYPLPLKRIRGQITLLPEDAIKTPKQVLCGEGYLNPAWQGTAVLGATFDLNNDNTDVTRESHEHNLAQLKTWLPNALNESAPDWDKITGRVAFRCASTDYQPAAGPIQCIGAFDQALAALGKNALSNPDLTVQAWHTGLYLLTGLGSKGLAMAPLLAEMIGDMASNQPLSLDQQPLSRVHPARFQIKALTRKQR